MHPIEQLRYVARAEGVGPSRLAREAAAALGTIADDPAGLVTGCRRLVERHAAVGPMWWVAARLLAAADPVAEAWRAGADLDGVPTPGVLAALLPEDATVTVVGRPEQVGQALRQRGDLAVLAVDAGPSGHGFVRRLRTGGIDADDVPAWGLGAAVADSDLVLLEAGALGATGFVAPSGSRAAAAVARAAGVEVWVVAGVGRVLPARLWEALCARLDAGDEEPWARAEEVVPLELAGAVVGPAGAQPPADAVKRADCPVVPELLKGTP